jgi:hypothetical protein
MDNTIGLVAVILSLGFPLGAMYTYYCVRKLRSQERLAAMARGVEIPNGAGAFSRCAFAPLGHSAGFWGAGLHGSDRRHRPLRGA